MPTSPWRWIRDISKELPPTPWSRSGASSRYSVTKRKRRKPLPFPKTDAELRAAGYSFKNGSHCRGCGRKIQWYTTPAKKVIPLDLDTYEPHFGTCPNRDDFRKKKEN